MMAAAVLAAAVQAAAKEEETAVVAMVVVEMVAAPAVALHTPGPGQLSMFGCAARLVSAFQKVEKTVGYTEGILHPSFSLLF